MKGDRERERIFCVWFECRKGRFVERYLLLIGKEIGEVVVLGVNF